MSQDPNTIGLTDNGNKIVEDLMKRGWFVDQMTACKFAMSVAIKEGIPPGQVQNAKTKWNKGSIDKDGGMETAMRELFGEAETPYRLAEYFMDKGLTLIEQKLKDNPHLDIIDLLS